MYVDALDGIVHVAFYEKMSNQSREEPSCCQRDIDQAQTANPFYMDEGVQIL